MKFIKGLFVVIICILLLKTYVFPGKAFEGEEEIKVAHILNKLSIDESATGVIYLPDSVPSVIRDVFDRYTRILAPNGKPIHFLAQAGWTEDQILKARNVLEYILTENPGSIYGNTKDKVANSMSNRNATMVLFNTVEDLEKAFRSTPLEKVNLSMQDLRSNECPAEGTKDYMNHITRDASFEEIWHLVHDNGIKQTLPVMIAEMRKANDAAARKGWKAWPEDEPQEHPNEYVGVLLDNYLDLWTIRPKKYEGRDIGPKDVPEGTSHFGRYFANSRKKLKKDDPTGLAVIKKFFKPYLTYNTYLPKNFKGTFSLAFDKNKAYTYKSRHLKDVTLRGNNPANLIGNGMDNKLTGNSGDNQLTGSAGNDCLYGGAGNDTVVFSGNYQEYSISKKDGKITVTDKKKNRDGQDLLINIEQIQFRDKRIKLSKIIYLAGTGEHRDLFLMNEDGSDKKQLIKTEFSVEWPSWSPDGKHIMFVSYDDEYRGLYITDNSGKNKRKVSIDVGMPDLPCWSHDSKSIAFIEDGKAGIKIANIEGIILRTVAGKGVNGAYQHWSPAEALLVFESSRDGNPEIYTINANTGEDLKRLTNNDQLDEWPCFSRDSSKIAWTRGVEGNKNIWVMNKDGSNKRQLTQKIPVGDAFHSFSPDGSRIVFTSGHEGKPTSIYVINLDGSGLKKIAEGASANWSPYFY